MQFCENCGKQLADGEVCSCQTAGTAANTTEKKDIKKMLPIICGAAAALVVVIVLICLLAGNGGSYKTPMDSIIKLINGKVTDPVKYATTLQSTPMDAKLMSDMFSIMKSSEDFKEEMADAKDDFKDMYGDLKDDYGNWKVYIKYSDNKPEKISSKDLRKYSDMFEDRYESYFEDELEDLQDLDSGDLEDLAEELDVSKSVAKKYVKACETYLKSFKKVKVTEGYTVSLRIYFRDAAEKEDYKTDRFEVNVYKVNGKWYMDSSSLYTFLSQLNYGSSDFSIDIDDYSMSAGMFF